MIASLIQFSIRYYGVVIAVALLILLVGGYRFATAGLDIFPEFSPKQVIIQTEASGLSSEQVELLVTQQVEIAISGVGGLQSTRSESIQGLSIITAIFPENSDVYRNRQLIGERLANISQHLPKGVTPVLVPLSSSSATILTLGFSSKQLDLMTLRSLVDWTISPRLLAVPGVADINIFGGEIKQLEVQIKPIQLRRFALSLDDVISAVSQSTAIQGTGFIENSNQRLTVQVIGQNSTPEAFDKIIVKREQGLNILLSDVATVVWAAKPAIGAAQIMGKTGVVVMVIGQYGANTLSVSKALEATLEEFKPILSKAGIDFYPHLFRPADYIERSISNLSRHLLVGGFFVLVILYLFLFNTRAAIISSLAIPVSLLGAVMVLQAIGANLNIMVLGGLAIALGEVVDDAIIDTENIFRRLRENQLLSIPLPIADVIESASLEVRSSVVYASFIVALVFVPLLTLDGVAGRLFEPLGYSYILAILISLFVALTLTPALCHALLGRFNIDTNEPPLIQQLKVIYKKILLQASQQFKLILTLCLVICITGFSAFYTVDHKFLPDLREGHYIVHTASIPGTSLVESIRMGSQLTKQLLEIKGIESVSQWAGRAERGADTYGSHYSEYEIRLKPVAGTEQQYILDQLRALLNNFPGIVYEANTFLTERVDETISGYTAPIVINIFGNDLTDLDNKAQVVAHIIKEQKGITSVQMRSPPGTPLVQVQLDNERLKFWGVRSEDVMTSLQTAYETTVVGKLFQGNKLFDIAVSFLPEYKHDLLLMEDLPVKSIDGVLVRLGDVANIKPNTGRYNILRQNSQRKQTITADITEGDMDSIMASLKTRIMKEVSFSVDAFPEFTGAAIEQTKARNKLILDSLLAGVGVMIFIYMAMGNLRLVLLTLANMPFALIGGVLAVLFTHAPLSVGSVVGFVTLFGITVRNSIMLLSHCQYLVNNEGRHWELDTMIQAAQERLPSILMTALVTALAMFPIAFNSDNPGSEIMGPMASIIIGGLFSSTLLNLLLLPCMLLRFGGIKNSVN